MWDILYGNYIHLKRTALRQARLLSTLVSHSHFIASFQKCKSNIAQTLDLEFLPSSPIQPHSRLPTYAIHKCSRPALPKIPSSIYTPSSSLTAIHDPSNRKSEGIIIKK